MAIVGQTGAAVEQMSIDEAYLDLSALCQDESTPTAQTHGWSASRQKAALGFGQGVASGGYMCICGHLGPPSRLAPLAPQAAPLQKSHPSPPAARQRPAHLARIPPSTFGAQRRSRSPQARQSRVTETPRKTASLPLELSAEKPAPRHPADCSQTPDQGSHPGPRPGPRERWTDRDQGSSARPNLWPPVPHQEAGLAIHGPTPCSDARHRQQTEFEMKLPPEQFQSNRTASRVPTRRRPDKYETRSDNQNHSDRLQTPQRGVGGQTGRHAIDSSFPVSVSLGVQRREMGNAASKTSRRPVQASRQRPYPQNRRIRLKYPSFRLLWGVSGRVSSSSCVLGQAGA